MIKQKNLVYYTVFGDGIFYKNLEISIKSLINLGHYTDDILVFSDKKINIAGVKNVVLDLPNGFKDWLELRFRCIDHFDFTGYENIIFLDADILVVKPLNELFDNNYDVVCFHQADHYFDTGFINTAFFDRDLFWKNWYKNSINAGQIIFNGARFTATLKTWQYWHEKFSHKKFLMINTKVKKLWSDQCSFNYIIRKNLISYKIVKNGLRLPVVPAHNIFFKGYYLIHYAAFPVNWANKMMSKEYSKLIAK